MVFVESGLALPIFERFIQLPAPLTRFLPVTLREKRSPAFTPFSESPFSTKRKGGRLFHVLQLALTLPA
jgi:hypothetical protein